MKEIKLVIWDLDDTFWNGTIGEEEVYVNKDALKVIKILNTRGIINSIVSKNDFNIAKNQLISIGVWEYFILPSISYEPKGERIKSLIKKLQLRDSNVMFVDDNHSNLMEAKFYNPNLTITSNTEISNLLNYPSLKGKKDNNLSRFKQYKHLESVLKEKNSFSSNIDFLSQSKIKLSIKKLYKKSSSTDIDRALELIHRTNQLNFTKKNIDKLQFNNLIHNKNFYSGLVNLTDKYGDYGIIGFFSLDKNNNELLHFLFSCRILNIGVESFVYQYLNCPKIEIKGEVAAKLDSNKHINWITIYNQKKDINNLLINKNKKDIYFKGGCDLTGILRFINKNQDYNISEDTNYLSNGLDIRNDHTYSILNSKKLSENQINELINKVPFIKKDTFNKNIFTTNNIIIFSVMMDYTHYVFQNKYTGIKITYGPFNLASDNKEYQKLILSYFKERSNNIDENFLYYFRSNYEFLGRISPDKFIKNLTLFKNYLNENTNVILINGAEINFKEKDVFYHNENPANRHKVMNEVLSEFVLKDKKFHLLDVRKFVSSEDHLFDSIRHYKLHIYNDLTKELSRIIDKIPGNENLKLSRKLFLLSYLKQNLIANKKLNYIIKKLRPIIHYFK